MQTKLEFCLIDIKKDQGSCKTSPPAIIRFTTHEKLRKK